LIDAETQSKIDEFKQEFPFERKLFRRIHLLKYYHKAFEKQYLRSKAYLQDSIVRTWHLMALRDKAIENGNFESVVYLTGEIKRLVRILVKYQDEQYFRRQGMGNDISKEMIQMAKDYPFEKLIEIKRNKMSCCPFHEDKTPSFSIKNNRGHCFSCGWSGDTLAYLMKKDGLSFGDAVKRLI